MGYTGYIIPYWHVYSTLLFIYRALSSYPESEWSLGWMAVLYFTPFSVSIPNLWGIWKLLHRPFKDWLCLSLLAKDNFEFVSNWPGWVWLKKLLMSHEKSTQKCWQTWRSCCMTKKIQHFYKLPIFQVLRIILFKMVTLIQINIPRYLNLLTYKQPPIHPQVTHGLNSFP